MSDLTEGVARALATRHRYATSVTARGAKAWVDRHWRDFIPAVSATLTVRSTCSGWDDPQERCPRPPELCVCWQGREVRDE